MEIFRTLFPVNCAREEIIDENGKIKTPINHEYDGKHPWHLEKYPDIPDLHIIKYKPKGNMKMTLEFKGAYPCFFFI